MNTEALVMSVIDKRAIYGDAVTRDCVKVRAAARLARARALGADLGDLDVITRIIRAAEREQGVPA
jgi:hypothetical protein